MKLLNKILKASLASLALLSTVTVSAVNRIYVEPLTVSNYEVTELKVMVECDEPVNAASIDLWIPEGLSFANGNKSWTISSDYKAYNFCKFQVGAQNNGDHFAKLFFSSTKLLQLEAGFHNIGTISVKADENVLSEPSVKQMKFNSEVTFPNLTSEKLNDQIADVTFNASAEQHTLNITFSQPEMVLNPQSPRELRLGMENSMDCYSFQLTLQVPAGITLSNAEPITDRMSEDVYFDMQQSVGQSSDYNIVVLSMNPSECAIAGHSGDFVKMNITADDDFVGENAILKITNIVLGSDNAEGFYGQDVTMTLTAGKLAYERAALAIEELQQKLTTAINNVNEQYPLAAEAISPMGVYQQISTLQSAVETAYENYTLTPNYDEVMAPVAAIEAAIDEYVEKCRVENERQTNNKAAYDAVVAQLNTLQEQYDAAIANVEANYADFRDAEAEAAAQKLITDAKAAAHAAYEAVETDGNFTYAPDTEAISNAIAAIVTDAKGRHDAEMARRQANQEAYDAVVAQLDALQKQLDDAIASIEANYPDFRDAEAEAAAQKLITDAKAAARTAFEAVATEGNFEYAPDTEAISNAIAALVTDAKARHDAEMARRAANESAYNAVVAGLDELQNQLDAALATLAEDYADYRDPAAEEAAQQLITDAKAAAQTAYEAVAEQGTFEYTADTESIAAAIAKLLTDAEARRIAELDRVQANQALYDGVIAQLDALQEQLDTTLATLAADYADFRDTDAEAAAQQMITDAKAAAQAALDAVAEEGNFDYTPDTEAISTAIAKLLTDAEARRAAELDRVQANETAHNAVIAQLDELQAQLDAALATLAEKYPTFRNEEAEQAAQQMITDAKAAADATFEAVAEEGVYSYTPDVEAITEAITSLVPDAEQRRVDYNTNLYDQDIATVDHLQELFDQAMADIKAVRPDFEGDANTSNVQEMIEDARSQCDEELARVEEEGLYEAPAFDAEQVEAAIQAMKDNAISGISDIYVDYNGEEVMIFTMDGTRHNKPVVGQVNIFRYKNGKCVKTFVNK